MSVSWGNSGDAVTDRLQGEIDSCVESLRGVLEPDAVWACDHCGGTHTRGEWMDQRILIEAGERHWKAKRGLRYGGLSSATWSLSVTRMIALGELEQRKDWRLRVVEQHPLNNAIEEAA